MLEMALYIGLYTTHVFMDQSKLNNDNQLIAVEVENVVVGKMKNSYFIDSYILAYNFDFEYSYGEYGILVGGASGYDYSCLSKEICYREDYDESATVPVFAPYIEYKGFVGLIQANAINVSYKIDF